MWSAEILLLIGLAPGVHQKRARADEAREYFVFIWHHDSPLKIFALKHPPVDDRGRPRKIGASLNAPPRHLRPAQPRSAISVLAVGRRSMLRGRAAANIQPLLLGG